MLSTLKIPLGLRQAIDQELQPGERLYWVEQPLARFFTTESVRTSLFGVLWTALAVFWTGGANRFQFPDLSKGIRPQLLFSLVGVCFAVIGIELILTPLWTWRKARNTVYLVTDQRALTIRKGWSLEIRSFSPDQLWNLERRERADGSGDVIVGLPRSGDSSTEESVEPTAVEVGFLGVGQARESERALRQLVERKGLSPG